MKLTSSRLHSVVHSYVVGKATDEPCLSGERHTEPSFSQSNRVETTKLAGLGRNIWHSFSHRRHLILAFRLDVGGVPRSLCTGFLLGADFDSVARYRSVMKLYLQ